MQPDTTVDATTEPAAQWYVVATGVKTYLVLSSWDIADDDADNVLRYEDIFELVTQLRSSPNGGVEKATMLMRPDMLMRPSRGLITLDGGTRIYATADLTPEDRETYEEQLYVAMQQANEALQAYRMRRANLVSPHDQRGGVGGILVHGR